MSLFGIFYNLALHGYALTKLHKIKTGRLGLSFPKIEKKGGKLVWIHAVSVGETRAVAPLIKKFKAQSSPPLILLTTVTETGYAEGLRSSPEADYHAYLPFDIGYLIRPIVKRVAPDLLVLTETDFWYNFESAVKESGGKIVLINGKISERSFKRFSTFPSIARRFLSPIDHFCLQGSLYRDRFQKLGVPPSKITITGNLKLSSSESAQDQSSLKEKLGLNGAFVLTLGSTHAPEEKLWIEALQEIWPKYPNLKVLLVPRHPERFNEVANLLADHSVPYARWSEHGTLHTRDLLLVDTMGELRQCYQLSNAAFVGGSFTPKVGGHNILEPSFYGKPVLFGPYMHSQPDFLDLAKTYNAGLQITPSQIAPTLEKMVTDPEFCLELGGNGLKLISESQGALERTWNHLLENIEL